MAYVKISFVKHARNLVNYLQADKSPNDLVNGEGLIPEKAADRFEYLKQLHDGKGNVQAIHIIQSWSPDDSKKLSTERFEELGKELVKSHFPGHDFLIVTHTGTGKTHNHIVVSPWHAETGQKIENKKFHLYKLRDISNDISRNNGLSIILPKGREKEATLPDKVKRMIRFNGRSYLLDLMQKTDVARAYATNFDDFVSLLDGFGVKAVVQNKNITYFYPGKEKGKRGSKLGKLYDKEALSKAFQQNQERVKANPKLRELIQKEIANIGRDPNALGRALSNISAPSKEFGKLRKEVSANNEKTSTSISLGVSPSEHNLRTAFVPIYEINRAKAQSIVDYAKRNKIALTPNQDGSHILTGRPHVLIQGTSWVNTRNRTRGSLIDFVAAYKNVSFIEAVAEINNSPRLLLFQKEIGKQERPFTSFYIPQEKRLSKPQAFEAATKLFRSFGIGTNHVTSLLGANQLQVGSHGVIRLFSKGDYSSGLEITSKENQWVVKPIGNVTKPFYSTNTGRHRAVVYSDPFTFINNGGDHQANKDKKDVEILALFQAEEKGVDTFIASNSHIKELHIVPPSHGQGQENHDLFIKKLKSKYSTFGISVESTTKDRISPSRSLDAPSI